MFRAMVKPIVAAIIVSIFMGNVNIVYASQVERIENIIKAPNDHRSYRGLKLTNRMKVILVNDPSAEKSAASMSVGAGALSDFRGVPGLANLVGYAIMRGSEKYPDSYNFRKFVQKHGGRADNPVTDADDQNFNFEIDPDYLGEALDRFAHLFIKPLIAYEPDLPMKAPLNEVLEEYKKRAANDNYRIIEVEKTMSKPSHPYNHFFLANVQLEAPENVVARLEDTASSHRKTKLYENVQKFYNMWYSSNIMSLVVSGRESLDELEEMVVSLFENVQDKDAKRFVYSCKFHPWGPEQMRRRIEIVPLEPTMQILRITFSVPDVRKQFTTAPDEYISYLLMHGGPGSLHSTLQQEDLCTRLRVNYYSPAGIGFYTLICDLTEGAVEHVNDIVNAIFQYIYMLKKDGIQEWVYEENRELLQNAFLHWIPEEKSFATHARSLACNMQDVPIQSAVAGVFFRGTIKWDPSLVRDFLTYLRPDNMNITVVSPSIEKKVLNFQVEKNYNTRFHVQRISRKLIEKWSTEEVIPGLQLPLPNEFIPKNFDLYPIDESEPKQPYIIWESQKLEIWFRQDDKFRIPELHIDFELISPATRLGVSEHVLWRIFHALLTKYLDVHLYNVEVLGCKWISWRIRLKDNGIEVNLYSYNDKLSAFLDRMLSEIVNFANNINEETFKMALEHTMLNLKTAISYNYTYQVNWYRHHLQNYDNWSTDDILSIGKRLQYADMKKFVSQIFRRMFIRGLIHGNCTRQKAMEIVNVIEKSFESSAGLLLQEVFRPRYVEISDGGHYYYRVFNEDGIYYSYNPYFQFDIEPSNLGNVMAYLLYEIINESCHEIRPIRCQEPTAVVHCVMYNSYGTQGLLIQILARKETRYFESQVVTFLDRMYNKLRNMSNEEFESYKEITSKREEWAGMSSLDELSTKYWDEISNRFYDFERTEVELNELRTLAKADLQTFFRRTLNESSPWLRKLVVAVYPIKTKLSKPGLVKYTPLGATKIEDIFSFKISSALLPFYFRPVPPSSRIRKYDPALTT